MIGDNCEVGVDLRKLLRIEPTTDHRRIKDGLTISKCHHERAQEKSYHNEIQQTSPGKLISKFPVADRPRGLAQSPCNTAAQHTMLLLLRLRTLTVSGELPVITRLWHLRSQ